MVKRYHVDADLQFVHERFTALDRHLASRATLATARLPVQAVTLRAPSCS